MSLAIELRGVRVEHGDHAVLRDVDFAVQRGTFVGLIGPNGGGKTTLLRTLLGLKRPAAGDVRVLGEAPRIGRPGIGYVPQEVVVDAEFPISAAAVLRMGLVWQSRRVRAAAEPRLNELVRRLDLGTLLERRYGSLSGGEKRRVLIARALALDPELLLLDEPDAGVDPGHIEPIYDLLSENTNRTVLLATHDLSVVSTHVDVIACVNRTVVQHASAQVDARMLRDLYGAGVEPLLHGPVRLLADHKDGHGHADFHARHHHGHAHHHQGGRCGGDGEDA